MSIALRRSRLLSVSSSIVAAFVISLSGLGPVPSVLAVHAAPAEAQAGATSAAPALAPTTVTIAGDLQSEVGCPGDWQPDCAATHLGYDAGDDVWQAVFNLPAGNWQYKAALNDSWDINYGLHAAPGGDNIPLSLPAAASVKFYYDDKTHWVTDNHN